MLHLIMMIVMFVCCLTFHKMTTGIHAFYALALTFSLIIKLFIGFSYSTTPALPKAN